MSSDDLNHVTESFVESMTPLGKQNVTKCVSDLRKYMHVKGIYLCARHMPEEGPFADPNNLNYMVDFLQNSTEMAKYKFWTTLSRRRQKAGIKLMSLRDESYMRIVIRENYPDDDVCYILLSGHATMTRKIGKDEVKMKYGSVFGATGNLEALCMHSTPKENLEPPLIVTIERGSLLRLRIVDYHKLTRADFFDEKNAVEQHGMLTSPFESWETSMKNLPVNLTLGKVITNDLQDPIYQYKQMGSIGRKLKISKGDPPMLYILVNGSFRVVITKEKSSTIAVGPGGSKLEVKTTSMPIVLLESGSVFQIDDKTFTIPGVAKDEAEHKKRKNISIRTNPLPLNTPDDKDVTYDVSDEDVRVELVFERTSFYLAIPVPACRNLFTRLDSQAVIKNSVDLVAESMAERMEVLSPWLHGTQRFRPSLAKRRAAATSTIKAYPMNSLVLTGSVAFDSTVLGSYPIKAKPSSPEVPEEPEPITADAPQHETGESVVAPTDSFEVFQTELNEEELKEQDEAQYISEAANMRRASIDSLLARYDAPPPVSVPQPGRFMDYDDEVEDDSLLSSSSNMT